MVFHQRASADLATSSAIPPDVELPLACTDDPPSREAL